MLVTEIKSVKVKAPAVYAVNCSAVAVGMVYLSTAVTYISVLSFKFSSDIFSFSSEGKITAFEPKIVFAE